MRDGLGLSFLSFNTALLVGTQSSIDCLNRFLGLAWDLGPLIKSPGRTGTNRVKLAGKARQMHQFCFA